MASGSIKNNFENDQVSLHMQAASAQLFTIGHEIYLQPIKMNLWPDHAMTMMSFTAWDHETS